MMMESKYNGNPLISISRFSSFARKFLFGILSMGPIPNHIAFIMDGNRRYSKKHNLKEGEGHELGFTALMSMLKYCYELEVKYVTMYALSLDNFKRRPEEVASLMKVLRNRIEDLIGEESVVNEYGIRVEFIGDLKLLDESVRLAAEKVMTATCGYSKALLSICIAYTSTNEIMNAVKQSCEEKWYEVEEEDQRSISIMDIERHMYMRDTTTPDILVRTSGETRLSNFLLWQSGSSLLYSPSILWPQIGLRHLVWAVINFQRNHSYLDDKKKLLLEGEIGATNGVN